MASCLFIPVSDSGQALNSSPTLSTRTERSIIPPAPSQNMAQSPLLSGTSLLLAHTSRLCHFCTPCPGDGPYWKQEDQCPWVLTLLTMILFLTFCSFLKCFACIFLLQFYSSWYYRYFIFIFFISKPEDFLRIGAVFKYQISPPKHKFSLYILFI